MIKSEWPAWFNGPDGQSQIFASADEVPAGWTTGAEKRSVGSESAPPPPPAAGAASDKPVLDANGHPWSPDLYAPTKTKTGAGLWRMKVGKSRPAPLPGYPLPPLDL